MFWNGMAYLCSMVGLAFAVSWVYSVAQEAYAPAQRIFQQTTRRLAKLLGVLIGLATVVYFLSRI